MINYKHGLKFDIITALCEIICGVCQIIVICRSKRKQRTSTQRAGFIGNIEIQTVSGRWLIILLFFEVRVCDIGIIIIYNINVISPENIGLQLEIRMLQIIFTGFFIFNF